MEVYTQLMISSFIPPFYTATYDYNIFSLLTMRFWIFILYLNWKIQIINVEPEAPLLLKSLFSKMRQNPDSINTQKHNKYIKHIILTS